MMEYLAIFLIAYGVILILGFILQFPFLYNNMKSKAMIKIMGKRNFNLLLLFIAAVMIAIGIIIMP